MKGCSVQGDTSRPARLIVSIVWTRYCGKRVVIQRGTEIFVDTLKMVACTGRYRIDIKAHEFELL